MTTAGWTEYLVSQPPIVLTSHSGDLASVTHSLHGVTGPWQVVPPDLAGSLPEVLTWARDHVGRQGAPPAPNREPLATEVASPTSTNGAQDYARERLPRLAFELDTYNELINNCDDVADWLTEVRDLLVAPAAELAGDTLATHIPSDTDYGPGRTMATHIYGWAVNGRLVMADRDDKGWARVLRRLRRRELREVWVDLHTLDGAGSRGARGTISIQVVMRDQFVKGDGPLPDDHPAQILVTASEELMAATVNNPTETLTALMQETARRFDAVYGYLTADRAGAVGFGPSPYETRHRTDLRHRPRLDARTRGMHWGNLLSGKHLDVVRGAERLRQLAIFARVEPCSTPTAPRWWVQLTDDPYGADRDLADQAATTFAAIMPQPVYRPTDRSADQSPGDSG